MGEIETMPIQQLSFLLFFSELRAAGSEEPAEHNSWQSHTSQRKGSDSARRVCTEPADMQLELPNAQIISVPRWLREPETSLFLPLKCILIQPCCRREAGLFHLVETGKMGSPSDRGCAKTRVICSLWHNHDAGTSFPVPHWGSGSSPG